MGVFGEYLLPAKNLSSKNLLHLKFDKFDTRNAGALENVFPLLQIMASFWVSICEISGVTFSVSKVIWSGIR